MTPSTQVTPWTTRRLLQWMAGHFEQRGVDSPRLVAEMLLAHVIGCERMRLYMEVDRPASPDELAQLRDLVRRAAQHEPVQYLTGRAWFFSREFEVDRSTLIPRPSTETLIEQAMQWHRAARPSAPCIADIGTGSGCIAITLAAQIPEASILATDIVPETLELARRNAARHGVDDRIEFRHGNGFAACGAARDRDDATGPPADASPSRREVDASRPGVSPSHLFDLICSNPPYISDAEWEAGEVGPNVKGHEPESALRGGPEGLDVINPLIDGAPARLMAGGRLLVEIGHNQREAVLRRARSNRLLADATVLKDHEGYWRVLAATRV